MQLNDNTNKQGITQMIDRLCSSTPDSYPIADKVRAINNYGDILFVEQILSANISQPDDYNYSALPETTIAFSVGDDTFSFPTDAIFIERIEIPNSSGDGYTVLKPKDIREDKTAWTGRDNGTPLYFDVAGEKFRVDRPFGYSGNMVIFYARDMEQFTASDTTKKPGFQRVLHQYLAYGASIEYCNKFKPERVGLYEKRLEELIAMAKRLVKKDRLKMRPATASRSETE